MPKKWNSWTAGEKKTQDQMQFWLPREPAEQLGGAWKVMQLLVLSKTSGRSSRAFFSSIPHQKAVQGDKPAIHHEDGAKDTNHPLLGELNFPPITSMEAALSKQCSVWRAGYGNKCKSSHWVNMRQWLVWVHNPAGNYGRNVSLWAHPCT